VCVKRDTGTGIHTRLRRRIHACHVRRRIHAYRHRYPYTFEEEDTCMSCEEEDTCIPAPVSIHVADRGLPSMST